MLPLPPPDELPEIWHLRGRAAAEMTALEREFLDLLRLWLALGHEMTARQRTIVARLQAHYGREKEDDGTAERL